MGTFERIRKVSPYALGIFVVVFIGFMVMSDADIATLVNQNNNPQTAPIGIINGEEILYKDFEEKVRQAVEQQRSQMQDPNAEIDQNQIMAQVWDQMVSEILMKQEAEKIGIKVTDAEVADNLLENPPDYLARSFMDTAGRFNRALYLELVTNPENIVKYMGQDPNQMDPQEKEDAIKNFRNDLIKIGDYIRYQKLSEALNTAVSTSGSQISPLFAQSAYKNENSVADVKFIHVGLREANPEEIKVSDEEIKAYFEANKKYYTQKNQRKIKFLSMPIQPSAEDSARADKKIQRILEDLQKGTDLATTDSIFEIKLSEYSGTTTEWSLIQDMDQMKTGYLANAPERQVVGPVRLPDGTYFLRLDGRRSGENIVAQASHILVGFGAANNKDSAKAEADKILKRVRSGEDFAKLAQELSEDKGSAVKGGDLGFFGKGRMVKPFEDAVFAANVGQIVGPVETQFGYHIIKVTDKKSDELKYSEIKVVPTISNPTKNKIFMSAHSFVKQVEEGTNFDSLAKRLNLRADTSDFMAKNFPLFGSWGLTNQVFDAEIGTVLQPKEMKNSGLVIVQVIDQRKEGAPELAAFEREIREKIIRKKQIAKLKDKANKIYNEVKSIGDLSLVTNYEIKLAPELKNNGQVPGAGMDIVFTSQIFKAETGKILEPIQGDGGWYIAQIVTKNIPDDNTVKNALPQHIKTLKQTAKGSVYGNWFGKVKENAKIEDMRGKFYTDF